MSALLKKQSPWVTDLTHYKPAREGHWPAYCAGFNLSLSGRIWLTDNRPIWISSDIREGIIAPCHRDIIDGEGEDKTLYSGLYCYNPRHKAVTLWLYPAAEQVLNENMRDALKTLIGVDRITGDTVVYSNTTRKKLFALKEA